MSIGDTAGDAVMVHTITRAPGDLIRPPRGRLRIARCVKLLALVLVLIVSGWSPASAMADQPANGLPKRPFFLIGHNPNTPTLVADCLHGGANGLEPDVSTLVTSSCPNDPRVLGDLVTCDTDQPGCVCSGRTLLVDWLDDLHAKVLAAQNHAPGYDDAYNNLAIITFDCKSRVCVSGNGIMILNAVRDRLNYDLNPPITVLFSCASVADGLNLFVGIDQGSSDPSKALRPNEGLMVDGEPNVDDVISMFRASLRFTGNIGYGAGSSAGPGGLFNPSLPRRIDHAVYNRAVGRLQMVTYVYTITSTGEQSYYMDAGLDGIIAEAGDMAAMKTLLNSRSDIRYAVRTDNLLVNPPNQAYGLSIVTDSSANSGTDAGLTFVLSGPGGSASITVDTSAHVGFGYTTAGSRMENGNTDYVTIYSPNLGEPLSLSISNNGAGSGPAWDLDSISVSSQRYLGSCPRRYDWAASGSYFELAANASQNFPLSQVSTSLVSAYAWRCSTALFQTGVSLFPFVGFIDAYNKVCAGGTVYVGESASCGAGYYGAGTLLNKPCVITLDPAHASGPALLRP